jgi:hypothetical protein
MNMADTIQTILSSSMKHKEQVAAMTEMAINDQQILAQVFDALKTGADVDRGTAAEVIKFVSKEKPHLMNWRSYSITSLKPKTTMACAMYISKHSKQ